jgi:hypothetical protein
MFKIPKEKLFSRLAVIILVVGSIFVFEAAFAQGKSTLDADLQEAQNVSSSGVSGLLGLPPGISGKEIASTFSIANIIAWLIFGAVGFVAFSYGKKNSKLTTLILGIVMMVYPYFVQNTILLYIVGTLICVGLYFWRDK